MGTPGAARGNGHGAAVNKVCPKHSPFGVIRGNVNHDCARFGLYLDNQYPRNLKRDANGMLTDHKSCDEFTSDGRDNGVVNEVHDELDYHNQYVGQYAMGDVQFVNYTGINNTHNMYWKTSKNFADGRLFHVVDSLIANDPSDSYGQMQFLGPSGPFTFGMSNTKFVGSNVGCGAICAGQHCGLGGAGGPCNVQYLMDNVDFSGVASGERRIQFGANAADPGFVLPIFTARDSSLGGYRTNTRKHLNGFGALEGCSPAGPEWADGYGCTKHIRRLNVWGHWDVGTLKISGPGYDVGANWGAPVHGMNAGHMLYEPMHRGYGAPVVLGEQYTLTGQMHDEMIPDFSDNVLASYFGHSESVNVRVGSNACHLQASDDKRFVSPLGLPSNLLLLPTHSSIQAGRLECGGAAGPTPPPTPFPTRSPTPPTPLAPGCYYKQALASSKCPGPFLDWERDVWGEANANSGASQEDCMARKAGHDEYCAVSTEWRFVPSAPTPAPIGDSSAVSFKPQPCNWEDDLHSAAGTNFEGATIRTDGGVRICQDCAQRCFAQMSDCVGFVFEQYSNSDRGTCTYFSRIDSLRIVTNGNIFALTTTIHFKNLPMPSLVQLQRRDALKKIS